MPRHAGVEQAQPHDVAAALEELAGDAGVAVLAAVVVAGEIARRAVDVLEQHQQGPLVSILYKMIAASNCARLWCVATRRHTRARRALLTALRARRGSACPCGRRRDAVLPRAD